MGTTSPKEMVGSAKAVKKNWEAEVGEYDGSIEGIMLPSCGTTGRMMVRAPDLG